MLSKYKALSDGQLAWPPNRLLLLSGAKGFIGPQASSHVTNNATSNLAQRPL
jgi:hypothetical protein